MLAGRDGIAICLTDAASGNDINVMRKGLLTLTGATMVVGMRYFVGKTAPGDIMPESDLASGDFVTFLGIAKTVTLLILDPVISGVAVPA